MAYLLWCIALLIVVWLLLAAVEWALGVCWRLVCRLARLAWLTTTRRRTVRVHG
jgi:hypothetical protein